MAEWGLTDFIDDVKRYANDEIRRMTQTAFERILERTPVRTGRLKAGWALEYMLNEGVIESVIYNDVPYVIFVENGTYKMAPRHMVEQTLNELEQGLI